MEFKVIHNLIPVGKVIPIQYTDKDGKLQTSTITRRRGEKVKHTGITIHNNGNKDSNPNGERGWLLNPTNQRSASWNECINEEYSVVAIPFGEVSYHSATNKGNLTRYSIEICEKNFEKVLPVAVKRIATILVENNWDESVIDTHKSWSGKDCPRLILPMWNDFIWMIKKERLNMLNKPEQASAWAVPAQEFCIENGISDGTRPLSLATRQEVMQMIFNYHKKFGK